MFAPRNVVIWLAILIVAAHSASASMLIENFDSLREGFYNTIDTGSGILLSDVDSRFPAGEVDRSIFAIDYAASPTWSLSPAKYLTAVGYSPGPGTGMGRVGTFRISFAEPVTNVRQLASKASIDVIASPVYPGVGDILQFVALQNGLVVESDTLNLHELFNPLRMHRLEISGVIFDELRVAAGPGNGDIAIAGFDNLQITLLPEASSFVLAGLGLAALLGIRSRRILS